MKRFILMLMITIGTLTTMTSCSSDDMETVKVVDNRPSIGVDVTTREPKFGVEFMGTFSPAVCFFNFVSHDSYEVDIERIYYIDKNNKIVIIPTSVYEISVYEGKLTGVVNMDATWLWDNFVKDTGSNNIEGIYFSIKITEQAPINNN